MSKLFETLEKIKKNETYKAPPGPSQPPRKAAQNSPGKHRVTVVILVIIGLGVAIYSISPIVIPAIRQQNFSQWKALFSRKTAPSVTTSTTAPPPTGKTTTPLQTADQAATSQQQPAVTELTIEQAKKELEKEKLSPVRKFALLNHLGTQSIQSANYWLGIYYLDQARKMEPNRIEPPINTAVALYELGLYTPAFRIFSEIQEKFPNHPAVRQNIEILRQSGMLNGDFSSAGQNLRLPSDVLDKAGDFILLSQGDDLRIQQRREKERAGL